MAVESGHDVERQHVHPSILNKLPQRVINHGHSEKRKDQKEGEVGFEPTYSGPKPDALTPTPFPKMIARAGFEPATFGL